MFAPTLNRAGAHFSIIEAKFERLLFTAIRLRRITPITIVIDEVADALDCILERLQLAKGVYDDWMKFFLRSVMEFAY